MGILDRLKSAAMTKAKTTVLPGSTGISKEFAIVDVETTGLDPRVHRIIEVGVVVTDARGNVRDELREIARPSGGVEQNPVSTRARGGARSGDRAEPYDAAACGLTVPRP